MSGQPPLPHERRLPPPTDRSSFTRHPAAASVPRKAYHVRTPRFEIQRYHFVPFQTSEHLIAALFEHRLTRPPLCFSHSESLPPRTFSYLLHADEIRDGRLRSHPATVNLSPSAAGGGNSPHNRSSASCRGMMQCDACDCSQTLIVPFPRWRDSPHPALLGTFFPTRASKRGERSNCAFLRFCRIDIHRTDLIGCLHLPFDTRTGARGWHLFLLPSWEKVARRAG